MEGKPVLTLKYINWLSFQKLRLISIDKKDNCPTTGIESLFWQTSFKNVFCPIILLVFPRDLTNGYIFKPFYLDGSLCSGDGQLVS